MKRTCLLALITTTLLIITSSAALAEWNFGLGTGPQLLSIDGDVGFTLVVGTVELDADFSASDMKDMTDNAFGLGGYATNGAWMFQASAGQLQLEDSVGGEGPTGTLKASVDFDITFAELTGGYYFYKAPTFKLMGYTGVRYLKHEIDMDLTGPGIIGVDRNKKIDESWTDILIGLSADVPFAEKWNWNVKADAGFGGSEGTYMASTGVTWRFYGGWSTTMFGKYTAVDYENDSRGGDNWYLYDVDESVLGLNIFYNW